MTLLKVATLNFSGINTSPFEYHDGTKQKLQLDTIFSTLLDQQKIQNPGGNWDIAKLDKIYNKQRYSILYRSDCGYVRGRLLNKDQFDVVWDLTFDLNQGIVGHMNIQDQVINKLRMFDWLAYKAFISLIFENPDMNNPSQYSVAKYKGQLKKWHSTNYLSSEKKIDHVRDYIINHDIDVMFIQQALTKRSSDYLPSAGYQFVKNSDSLIVYKKDSYFLPDIDNLDAFDAKYKTKLNFNKDSVYLKGQNVLLMSVHLSSKSINVEQAKQMYQTLKEIQQQYKNIAIIIGTDANHYLNSEGNFNVFPNNRTATTRKKRTHMQCQFEKSDKLVQQTKDYILTNQIVDSWNVSSINSDQISKDLLPNNFHPYDHFLVSATLKFDQTKFKKEQCIISSKLLRIGSIHSQSSIRKSSVMQDILGRVVPPEQTIITRRRTLTTFPNQYQPIIFHKYLSSAEPPNSINLFRINNEQQSKI